MALTKVNFYISVLLVTVLVMGGLIATGQALLSSTRITLTDDSEDYINTINAQSEDSHFNDVYEANASATKEEGILGEDTEGGIPVVSDVLAALNFIRNMVSKIGNFFKIVYNIPTTILISLGLPLEAFAFTTNTIVYILFVGLIVMIIKTFFK